jgi:hypothetical protein
MQVDGGDLAVGAAQSLPEGRPPTASGGPLGPFGPPFCEAVLAAAPLFKLTPGPAAGIVFEEALRRVVRGAAGT